MAKIIDIVEYSKRKLVEKYKQLPSSMEEYAERFDHDFKNINDMRIENIPDGLGLEEIIDLSKDPKI